MKNSENIDIVERRIHSDIIRNNGITLVALVITIIILLILAGISIVSLTENGLFKKTKLAKEKQENAQIEEEKNLKKYENEIEDYLGNSRETYNSKYNVLWQGTETAIKNETTATESLSESFTNYDMLLIDIIWDSAQSNAAIAEFSIDTNSLKDRVNNSDAHLICTTYGTGCIFLNFSKDYKKFWIIDKDTINSGRSPYAISKIIGIKF